MIRERWSWRGIEGVIRERWRESEGEESKREERETKKRGRERERVFGGVR